MKPDFEALVQDALAGNPGGLLHAMQQHSTYIWVTEHRKLSKADDWPPCVADMLRQFGRVSQPNGRPMRGRPKKELQQLAKANREWFRYVVQHLFDRRREMAKFSKSGGAREIIGDRDYPMPSGTPSDIAFDCIEEQMGIPKNTALDILYPKRRK